MKTTNSQTSVDDSQEDLLRVTLTAHTLQSIDLEADWQTVAQRMTALEGRVSAATHPRLLAARSFRPTRRRHIWPILAAVAALLLVAFGIVTAGPFFHLFGENNNVVYAFADVSQSQQSQGITINVTKGYVDPSRIYIEYNVQLPATLSKGYQHATAIGITKNPYMQVKSFPTVDRNGHPTGGQSLMGLGVCDDSWQGSGPAPCINIVGGDIEHHLKGNDTLGNNNVVKFRVPAAVNNLTFTWDVKEVQLSGPSYQHGMTIHGNWHFQFTLPFHHQPHDPILPFPIHQGIIIYVLPLEK
ncbi:DUF4179 domain-containing protein [Dictyobacter aurantiacus]|uniref:Uncharacterized protein n=1 Tax=Dictyobacter aurantiacus TaxID=1936993 RepID=A0A401ZAW4_9CHLR|nr:DUF4179 domain-containing protein [Dictyobacter aurantiacus]GCE03972.1 hypothetical protein KDAU_13010 [Dictyobacter aurantiacus]